MKHPDIVICGAGIAGVSAAYFLSVHHGIHNIQLFDPNPPLSLTSDHSTECYRNWWPGPGDSMVRLMNRSIDLMEIMAGESGNSFRLNRRGYLYVTTINSEIPKMIENAQKISNLGAGPLRIHHGKMGDPDYSPLHAELYEDQPTGADLLLDPDLIQKYFPYLSKDVLAALHVRRAGWLSAQQLGMYLLQNARRSGVTYVNKSITQVITRKGNFQSIQLSDGTSVDAGTLIIATGPYLQQVGMMMDIKLPVFNELHQKVAFVDQLGVIDRAAPLLILQDNQYLPWGEDETEILREDETTSWMLEELPSGIHTRPEGGLDSQIVLILWEFASKRMEPIFPIPHDDFYPDIVLRGMIKLIPGLRPYLEKAPRPRVDGGYYTKTIENRPLIGRLPVRGAYMIGALSGFGIMASCAAGELIASYVNGGALPDYAPAFSLERYENPTYLRSIENLTQTGQI